MEARLQALEQQTTRIPLLEQHVGDLQAHVGELQAHIRGLHARNDALATRLDKANDMQQDILKRFEVGVTLGDIDQLLEDMRACWAPAQANNARSVA